MSCLLPTLRSLVLTARRRTHALDNFQHSIAKEWGVTGSLFGVIPGPKTFVLDKEMRVTHVFESLLNGKAHVNESLEAITKLKSGSQQKL